MEITGPHTVTGYVTMNHSPYHPDLAPHHFHLLKTLQKCLAKEFAKNADMKQAVTSWLRHVTLSSTPQHKPWYHGGTNA
jgi:hypothetical protein